VDDVVDGLSVEEAQLDGVVGHVADSLTQPLADDQLAVAVDRRRPGAAVRGLTLAVGRGCGGGGGGRRLGTTRRRRRTAAGRLLGSSGAGATTAAAAAAAAAGRSVRRLLPPAYIRCRQTPV